MSLINVCGKNVDIDRVFSDSVFHLSSVRISNVATHYPLVATPALFNCFMMHLGGWMRTLERGVTDLNFVCPPFTPPTSLQLQHDTENSLKDTYAHIIQAAITLSPRHYDECKLAVYECHF